MKQNAVYGAWGGGGQTPVEPFGSLSLSVAFRRRFLHAGKTDPTDTPRGSTSPLKGPTLAFHKRRHREPKTPRRSEASVGRSRHVYLLSNSSALTATLPKHSCQLREMSSAC
jgi:hypothetical protein